MLNINENISITWKSLDREQWRKEKLHMRKYGIEHYTIWEMKKPELEGH